MRYSSAETENAELRLKEEKERFEEQKSELEQRFWELELTL